ncbi:ribosomal-protein-alanine N-acetyltransferase [Duganella sp. CF458]|uniref:GNAT family N-acetyltransferase n=1 Tax=Duganella sp. CF458 TaxID=1884368 RepID=UPI0008EFF584|nr:GNAT family N-acetyltransferase [Duganella sp. CF458]SFG50527.1 ribosomal-protein-alanine N-acetyltransferase [Duganella sp. CF458]
MQIRTLTTADASALLEFELANRDWFESQVDARAPDFYNLFGVAAHIGDYLARHAAGTMHPCLLLEDDGAIVGRCNLKDIDRIARRAEVGYRIAATAIGRGLAGAALTHLMELAYGRWELRGLDAHVTIANAASARVLERAGFALAGPSPILARVAEQPLACLHYRHH